MRKLLVFVFTLSAPLISCKKSDSKIQEVSNQPATAADLKTPVKNDRMVLWLTANPEILNPILSTDAYSKQVLGNIYDSLVRYDVFTGEPVGLLAESWKISKDGLTYNFKIRSGVTFHDGTPLTAEDIKFSFDLIKNPKVDAGHLQNYYSNLSDVIVKGPHEIEFQYKEKYYRNMIMVGLMDILPKHIYGVGDFNKHPANRSPVGSGPYRFRKWDTGRTIELERYKNYWGNNVPEMKDFFNFNEIYYRIITDDSVALMALKKKEIDVFDPTPSMYVNELAKPEIERDFYREKYSTTDGNGFGFIGLNLQSPLFKDKKVRQALQYAMPRDMINEKLFKGVRTPAVGPFPVGSEKNDPNLKPYPYDIEMAKDLLTQAGWRGNPIREKDGQKLSFELLFPSGAPDSDRIALIYQQTLKPLGIELKIRTLEWTVFIKQIEEKKFDAIMMGWGGSLDSDPYQIWHSSQSMKGGSNRISYSNSRVDELLEKARTTLDRAKRNELYKEFSKIIYDDCPYIFVFERPHLLIVNRRIQNVLPIGKLGSDSGRWFTPLGQEKYKTVAN